MEEYTPTAPDNIAYLNFVAFIQSGADIRNNGQFGTHGQQMGRLIARAVREGHLSPDVLQTSTNPEGAEPVMPFGIPLPEASTTLQ